jgi:hypothetical protein
MITSFIILYQSTVRVFGHRQFRSLIAYKTALSSPQTLPPALPDMVRPITDNMPLAEKEAQAIAEAAYRDYARRSCAARTPAGLSGQPSSAARREGL